jgi:hypothetical protein
MNERKFGGGGRLWMWIRMHPRSPPQHLLLTLTDVATVHTGKIANEDSNAPKISTATSPYHFNRRGYRAYW